MTFEGLIENLGERLGIAFEDAGGAVAVEVDGETVVLQDAGELLLLRAEVGEIPADGRLHIHKYNWMERLDADAVLDAVGKLSDVAAAWRRILSDSRPGASPADGKTSALGAEFISV